MRYSLFKLLRTEELQWLRRPSTTLFSALSALLVQACGGGSSSDPPDPPPPPPTGETKTGDAGANDLEGGAGNDTLSGLAGDDTLSGLGGADVLDGGAGEGDVADYSASGAGVTLRLADTADANGYISGTGGDAQGDRLRGIEHLTGSGQNDFLGGAANVNILIGGAGNDTLVGLGGADVLDGGAGEGDVADYSASGAGVTLRLADTADANGYISGTGGDAQGDRLRGIEHLTGSSQNDFLGGAANVNILTGGAGNDTLAGLGGGDTLEGGAGADVFQFSAAADPATRDDILDFAPGTDRIDLSSIDADPGTSGTQEFAFLFGQAFSAPGQLRYYVANAAHTIVEVNTDADLTSAEFSFRLVNFTGELGAVDFLGVMEPASPTSTEQIVKRGDSLANQIVGTAKTDILVGLGGDDVLSGLEGADVLDGGSGADTASYSESLEGVTVNLASTRDQEGYMTGTGGDAQGDRLRGIEYLIGSQQAADTLTGDARANVLEGGGGDDVLTGGAGADRFAYSGADSTSLGADTITDFASGEDKIDLRNLDADSTSAGTQSFTFVGAQAAFSAAGQVRYVVQGNDLLIEINTDTDTTAEATILLTGVDTVTSNDFEL